MYINRISSKLHFIIKCPKHGRYTTQCAVVGVSSSTEISHYFVLGHADAKKCVYGRVGYDFYPSAKSFLSFYALKRGPNGAKSDIRDMSLLAKNNCIMTTPFDIHLCLRSYCFSRLWLILLVGLFIM